MILELVGGLFLVSTHLIDFDTTHPKSLFIYFLNTRRVALELSVVRYKLKI
jgi:hypothetical protein